MRQSEACCGDIVAIPKLKDTKTGDTFGPEGSKIRVKGVAHLPGLINYVVHPKTRADEDKLSVALARAMEEDKTLSMSRDEITAEFLLNGMGQAHLEVTLQKLSRKYAVAVELKKPKVPYKETIKGRTKVQGRYKKQSGGKGQYGDCWIEIQPKGHGEGFEFVDNVVGGSIPRQYIPAVEKGIIEAMHNGVIAGYPVVDVKVSLYDGSYHDVDSSEMAFKIAGSMAFKKGFKECKPILLEPIMNMEIAVPDANMGDVIGDINGRRGKVLGMEANGHNQIIRAQVPLVEILTYVNDLTSITRGKGSYTMEHSHNEEVPSHLAQKIIAEKATHGEDEE
jgi:elongation factor G